MTRSRGEYRSIYTVLVDGPDYQALPPEAKLVFLTLKLSLGPSQIDTLPAVSHVLAERTGYSPAVVETALRALSQAAKPWVLREGNVIWVVDGLRFDPTYQPSNPNHRRALHTHLDSLPRLAVVEQFRRHYRAWFEAVPSAETPGELPASPAVLELGLGRAVAPTQPAPDPVSDPASPPGCHPGEGPSRGHSDAIDIKEREREREEGAGIASYLAREGPGGAVVALNRLVEAANTGLDENPLLPGPGRVRYLHAHTGHTLDAAQRLGAVPLDFACRVIQERAAAYQPTETRKQPASLGYFVGAVLEAWQQHTAPRGAPPSTTARRGKRPAAPADPALARYANAFGGTP